MMDSYDCKMQKTVKVFIGFIPSAITEEMLKSELSKLGKLSSVFYMADLNQQSRGWAFVTFCEREDGIAAVRAINGNPYFEGSTEPCKASLVTPSSPPDYVRMTCHPFAGPPTSPGYWQQFRSSEGIPYYYNMRTGQTQWERPREMEQHMPTCRHAAGNSAFGPPGSNLFVFHLPAEWTDMDLVHNFRSFGTVLSARVQRDSSGRNRGFGFISYDNPQSASNAIKSMNGFNACGKYLKVQLKKGDEQLLEPSVDGSTKNGTASGVNGVKKTQPRDNNNGTPRRGGTDPVGRRRRSSLSISPSSQPNQHRNRTPSQAVHQNGSSENNSTPPPQASGQGDGTSGTTNHEM